MKNKSETEGDLAKMKWRCMGIGAVAVAGLAVGLATLVEDGNISNIMFRLWLGTITFVIYAGIYTGIF